MLPRLVHPITYLFSAMLICLCIKSMETAPGEWYKRNDFGHYYITSYLLSHGENPYTKNLESYYEQFGLINCPQISQATNPPALALLLAPITNLPPKVAFNIWSMIQLSALIASLFLCFKLLRLNPSAVETATIILLVFSSYTTGAHLEHGQVQLLILFLSLLGISGMQNGAIGLGAFMMGVGASLKFVTLPLIYVAYLGGRRRGVINFLLGFFAPYLLILLLCGPHIFTAYFKMSVPYISDTLLRFNGSVGFVGSYVYLEQLLKSSTFDMRVLNLISIIMFILLLGIDYQYYKRYRNLNYSAAVVLSAVTLFSPTSWNHYLVLTFFGQLLLLSQSEIFIIRGLKVVPLLLCFLLLAMTQGRLTNISIEWQVISIFWGVTALSYLLFLLFKTRAAVINELSQSNSES